MTVDRLSDFLSLAWILACGFLVLFMQAGFTLVTVGFARARHSGHVALLNLAAVAVGAIAYYLVGFALQYGGAAPLLANTALGHLGLGELNREIGPHGWGFLGARGFGLVHAGPGTFALFFFELVFLQTAVIIPVGAIMERIRLGAFLLIAAFIAAVVFPLFANWCWGGGFLSTLGQTLGLGHGYVDFAGSSVVHATGGFAALAIVMALGSRMGKFNREGKPMALPGHNIPLVVIGTLVLLFGWMGFNCGSTLSGMDAEVARVAVNTVIAAASACLVSLLYIWKQYGKPDIGMAASGLQGGVVAVTAACAFVEPWAAFLIGAAAGVIMCVAIQILEWRGQVDDPCSVVAIHGVCGAWGVLSLGLFADGSYGVGWNGVQGTVRGLFYGDPMQLAAQVLGLCTNFLFVFGAVYIFCRLLDRVVPLHVTGRQESDGLDIGECGAVAYPDFHAGGLISLGTRQ